jgi:hypothetical protein
MRGSSRRCCTFFLRPISIRERPLEGPIGYPQTLDVSQLTTAFADAIAQSDGVAMFRATRLVRRANAWPKVLTELSERPSDNKFGASLVMAWLTCGIHLGRAFKEHNGLFAAALRQHMPRYDGPGLTLFRGQLETFHRKRHYGMSWTAELEVAQRLATWHAAGESDAVVLRMEASPEMIIADLREHWHDQRMRERQLLIDPRMVREVEVLETVPVHHQRAT